MTQRLALLLLFVACAPGSQVATLTVEPNSPAIEEGELVQSVGIETLGGVFTPLLEAGCRVPCEATNTFSTAIDDQDEISLTLFRGTAGLVAQNHFLGEFVVVGIPPAPGGEPQVAITVRAEESAIALSASDTAGSDLRFERVGAEAGRGQ